MTTAPGREPAPLLVLDDVRFAHPGQARAVLDGAQLSLSAGERVGILGRNGAGKSTLLHLCTGLSVPEKGRVLFKGRELRSEKDFARARRSMGYVLQNAADQLFCATVLEDVAFGPYNVGHSAADAERMALAALEELSLAHLAHQNGQRLSGGEQRLAALATVLVMGVDVLFLDEPTNDLDDAARRTLLEALARHPLPALIISHDRDFLRRTCTRFLLLKNGRLCDCVAEG